MITVHISNAEDKDINPLMVRDDIPDVSETMTDYAYNPQFLVVLGGNYSYTLHWSKRVPQEFIVEGLGVEKDHPVQIGICLPRDSQFELKSWAPVWRADLSHWTRVNSTKQLSSKSGGGQYYWDNEVGLLFIQLESLKKRTPDVYKDCSGLCPVVKITLTSGDRKDADCRARAYPKYLKTLEKHELNRNSFESALPRSLESPPDGVGAGPTKPFATRSSMKSGCGYCPGRNK